MLNELEQVEVRLKLIDCQTEIKTKNSKLRELNNKLKDINEEYKLKLFRTLVGYYGHQVADIVKYYSNKNLYLLMKQMIIADFEGLPENSIENNLYNTLDKKYNSKTKDWWYSAVDNIASYLTQYTGSGFLTELTTDIYNIMRQYKNEIHNSESNINLISEIEGLKEKEKLIKKIINGFEIK